MLLLPDETLLRRIAKVLPCREQQIRQLAYLLWPTLPSPATVVVHGLEATGKSSVVRALLQTAAAAAASTASAQATAETGASASANAAAAAAAAEASPDHSYRYAVVNATECITARHLFECAVAAVEDALASPTPPPLPSFHHSSSAAAAAATATDNAESRYAPPALHSTAAGTAAAGRCETLSMLAMHLERLLLPMPAGKQEGDEVEGEKEGEREGRALGSQALQRSQRRSGAKGKEEGEERKKKKKKKKFVLVLDGIDRQREAPSTLLPALARLGEIIPTLTIVMIVTVPHPRFFRAPGIPYVHFPPYDRQAALTIVGMRPRRIFEAPPITTTTTTAAAAASSTSLPLLDASLAHDATKPLAGVGSNHHHHSDNNNINNDNDDDTANSDNADNVDDDSRWLWAQYAGVVWDTYARGGCASRDLAGFRGACDRLWRAFVQPVVAGRVGARDVARLVVVARRALFFHDDHGDGAAGVLPFAAATLAPPAPPPPPPPDHHAQTHAQNGAPHDSGSTMLAATARKEAEKRDLTRHDLPYYSKYLLFAAYLASHNPARLDAVYFMRSSESTKRRQRRRQQRQPRRQAGRADGKGGGGEDDDDSGADRGRGRGRGRGRSGGGGGSSSGISKKTTSASASSSKLASGPQPFVLERMMAIFYAILLPNSAAAAADGRDATTINGVGGSGSGDSTVATAAAGVRTADLHTQFATLASLRLVVRAAAAAASSATTAASAAATAGSGGAGAGTGAGAGGGGGVGGGGGGASSALDAALRWRANVGWEYIRALARSVRFDIEDYMAQ